MNSIKLLFDLCQNILLKDFLNLYYEKEKQPIITVSLCIVACLGIIFASIMEPMTQDSTYHNFADKRNVGVIKNALNMLSNLPFL